MSLKYTLTRVAGDDEIELEVTVEYTYHRPYKGSFDNGFQLEPDEPACCEIDSVKDKDGTEVALIGDEQSEIEQACMDKVTEEYEQAMEDRVDAMMEGSKVYG